MTAAPTHLAPRTVGDPALLAPAPVRRRGVVGCYLQLTKARLSLLVLWTTAVGFVLASETVPGFDAARLLWTLVGTALAAGSANAFNQIIEAGRDRAMVRTRQRPLPSGDLGRAHAIVLASGLGVGGVAVLAALVGPLAASLALLTILIYVLLYTPLKVRSSLNTLVGAVCGAIPPIIGWVGATGRLDAGAVGLGAILFVWQIPHFLALAWMYRADYARGRFAMLPVFDTSGQLTCQLVVLTCLMLVPLALSATLLGLAGWVYTTGAVALGLWMLARGISLYRTRTEVNARRVFLASLVYLATVLALLVIDRGPIEIVPPVHQLVLAG